MSKYVVTLFMRKHGYNSNVVSERMKSYVVNEAISEDEALGMTIRLTQKEFQGFSMEYYTVVNSTHLEPLPTAPKTEQKGGTGE